MTCKIRPATSEEVLAGKPEWALSDFDTGYGISASLSACRPWIVTEGAITAQGRTVTVGDFVLVTSIDPPFPLVSDQFILTDDGEVVVGDGTMRALGRVNF